ncbi:MAG: hypothetical protein ACPIOQ_75190, partial [Promethearchaeia archaeon]
IVPHINDSNLELFIRDLEEQLPTWKLNPATISKGTVTCTGNQFCGQVTDTLPVAVARESTSVQGLLAKQQ